MFVSPDCVNFYFSCWSGSEIIRLCRLWKHGQGVVGALSRALKCNWQSVGVQRLLSQRSRELSCLPGVGVLQPYLAGTSTWFCHG